MRMRRGNINKILVHLQDQIAVANERGAPNENMNEAWDKLAAFLKTSAGITFDQKYYPGMTVVELLKAAYQEMEKQQQYTCEQNQKPIDSRQ